MDLPLTLALGGAALLFAVIFGWLGARPPEPFKGPRMVPWRFLMLLATAAVMMMGVHALNLLGFVTGGAR
jgi:hypothetical protein